MYENKVVIRRTEERLHVSGCDCCRRHTNLGFGPVSHTKIYLPSYVLSTKISISKNYWMSVGGMDIQSYDVLWCMSCYL